MREFIKFLEETPATPFPSPSLPPGMSYSEEDNYPYFFLQQVYIEDKAKSEASSDGQRGHGRGLQADGGLVTSPSDEKHKVLKNPIEPHVFDSSKEWFSDLNNLVLDDGKKGRRFLMTCKYDWRHEYHVKEQGRHENNCFTRCHLTKHIMETKQVDGTKERKVYWVRGVPWGYKTPKLDDLPSIWKVNNHELPMEIQRFVVDAQKTSLVSFVHTTSVFVPGEGFTQTNIIEDWSEGATAASSATTTSSPSSPPVPVQDQQKQWKLPPPPRFRINKYD